MNGFSREAFFAWWQGETVDRIGFVDQEHAAYHAWAAALEWYGRQLHTLEASGKGTDEEITTLSYEFSDEVETGDDYFMTVVDPVGFARAVLERWGNQPQ